jgi:hypothetical protein
MYFFPAVWGKNSPFYAFWGEKGGFSAFFSEQKMGFSAGKI